MKRFLQLIVLVGLVDCTSVQPSIDYRVYVLNLKEQKLWANDSKDDLPISVCNDTLQSKANCYIFLREEYIKLRRDLVNQSLE